MTKVTTHGAPAPDDSSVDAIRELTRVLDRIGDALAAVDTPALLAIESELDGALAAMSATATFGDRAAARAAAKLASTALVRCRRLGSSSSGLARALARVGRAGDGYGYDCMGGYVEPAARASVLVRA